MNKSLRLIIEVVMFTLFVIAGYLLYSFIRGATFQYYLTLLPFASYLRALFILYLVAISVFITMDNRSPSKTISWLILIIAFPAVGFFAYLTFGRSFRKEKIVKAKKRYLYEKNAQLVDNQLEALQAVHFTDRSHIVEKLAKLLINNARVPYYRNNHIEIFSDGQEMFQSLLNDISQAKLHIHLEYFIVKDDETGRRLKAALIERARAGVEVRLCYDSVGSFRLTKNYLADLKRAGVRCHAFLPVIIPLFSRELNYRNHRKITVIDGKIGYIGGMNIGDEYLGKDPDFGFWRDTQLRVQGGAVESIQSYFLIDWMFVSGHTLPLEAYIEPPDIMGDAIMQVLASGPDADWGVILQAYFILISNAVDRVWIATPYLVPEESLTEALRTAALAGVDVRIIIPAVADHFFVYWATQANLDSLLKAGVKVYHYTNGFIHAKVIIADEHAASVGSANLDIRSLELNFEINGFIYDKPIIEQLAQSYLRDIDHSRQIDLVSFKQRPWYHCVLEAIGRLVSPLQ